MIAFTAILLRIHTPCCGLHRTRSQQHTPQVQVTDGRRLRGTPRRSGGQGAVQRLYLPRGGAEQPFAGGGVQFEALERRDSGHVSSSNPRKNTHGTSEIAAMSTSVSGPAPIAGRVVAFWLPTADTIAARISSDPGWRPQFAGAHARAPQCRIVDAQCRAVLVSRTVM